MDKELPYPAYLAPRLLEDALDFAGTAGTALISGGTVVMPQLGRMNWWQAGWWI